MRFSIVSVWVNKYFLVSGIVLKFAYYIFLIYNCKRDKNGCNYRKL